MTHLVRVWTLPPDCKEGIKTRILIYDDIWLEGVTLYRQLTVYTVSSTLHSAESETFAIVKIRQLCDYFSPI